MIEWGNLLAMLGYDIQIKDASEFLMDPYKKLLIIRHSSDDYMSVVITPIQGDSKTETESLISDLLSSVPTEIEKLGVVLCWFGGYHEPDELIDIRQRKEHAIINQKFDLAADLRDRERERKLIRNRA